MKKSKRISGKVTLNQMIIGLVAFLGLAGMVALSASKQNTALQTQAQTTQAEQKAALVSFVDQGANLISTKGTKAYPEFRKKDSGWWNGDSYLFVYDLNGKTLVLPPQQNLEGTNRMNTADSNGVYFVKEMINTLKNANSGWVSYSYPKPGETISSPKLSYFRKVSIGKQAVLVGSGVYLK